MFTSSYFFAFLGYRILDRLEICPAGIEDEKRDIRAASPVHELLIQPDRKRTNVPFTKLVPTPKLHPTDCSSQSFFNSTHFSTLSASENTINSGRPNACEGKPKHQSDPFPRRLEEARRNEAPGRNSLSSNPAPFFNPTFSQALTAKGMKASGSPLSCLSPFHLLARSGSDRKSSKNGLIEKVSGR